MINERYYYGIMTREEKEAYKVIYNGLKIKESELSVWLFLSAEQIRNIYLKVLYDNPLLFYVNQTIIRMKGMQGRWILLPEYLYLDKEINAITNDIRRIASRIVKEAKETRLDEFYWEKYLHDSIVKNVTYDYEALRKHNRYNAYSIVGVFLEKKAVCEGISKAFKLLCNEAGMKCIIVLGKAAKDGDFSRAADYHAWNLVKIDNESYHVDVTWDNYYDLPFRHISYDYFNVTTDEILLDHQPIEDNLPLCTAERRNYFYSTKSFVNTYEELAELISARINHKEIMFKVKTGGNDFQKWDKLEEKIIKALTCIMKAEQKNGRYVLMYNKIHNIVKIIFV